MSAALWYRETASDGERTVHQQLVFVPIRDDLCLAGSTASIGARPAAVSGFQNCVITGSLETRSIETLNVANSRIRFSSLKLQLARMTPTVRSVGNPTCYNGFDGRASWRCAFRAPRNDERKWRQTTGERGER